MAEQEKAELERLLSVDGLDQRDLDYLEGYVAGMLAEKSRAE